MRIFLSWSGKISERIASLIRQYIPLFLDSSEISFFYSPEIKKGVLWPTKLFENISNCQTTIICLTPENVEAPWINFEGGANAAKGFKTCPIFFGFQNHNPSGPLSYFQVTYYTKTDFFKLICSLNDELENKCDESTLKELFEKQWKSFKSKTDNVLRDHYLPVAGSRWEELRYFLTRNIKPIIFKVAVVLVLLTLFVYSTLEIIKERRIFHSKWGRSIGLLSQFSMSDIYAKHVSEKLEQYEKQNNDPNNTNESLTKKLLERTPIIWIPSSEITVSFSYQVDSNDYSSSELGPNDISYTVFEQYEKKLGQTIYIHYLKHSPQTSYMINPEGGPFSRITIFFFASLVFAGFGGYCLILLRRLWVREKYGKTRNSQLLMAGDSIKKT